MFLLATIIYFGERPVGYDVYRAEDLFHFKPAIGSRLTWQPPAITAAFSQQLWYLEGTEDRDVIEQVKKTIKVNELIASLNIASGLHGLCMNIGLLFQELPVPEA